jgi:hypothetical protein
MKDVVSSAKLHVLADSLKVTDIVVLFILLKFLLTLVDAASSLQ